MADTTGIEWTEATWNPLTGCTKVSAGCDHCYAETIAHAPAREVVQRRGLADRLETTGRANARRDPRPASRARPRVLVPARPAMPRRRSPGARQRGRAPRWVLWSLSGSCGLADTTAHAQATPDAQGSKAQKTKRRATDGSLTAFAV
ncbi:hypothetical protein SEA_DANTE_72 [Mycobacterium phage Dante]|uniref:DUF5131 family protein n=1 Tax=Mycobacterium phage Dante TaxID=1698357 RepID=A0A0K1Y7T9_9CAUD|nr:hypothetical protein AVV07_gp072 [Mycobacterium phage Dante]AKY02983.1 hypothetical protein SEA_DANTE_72 [Mycobacterium phage Dante]